VTAEDRKKLRDLAIEALRATGGERWVLQTSNSFRRIGTRRDGDVLCAVTHPVDRHPDLLAPRGVLEYLVAVDPCVVLELLDEIDDRKVAP